METKDYVEKVPSNKEGWDPIVGDETQLLKQNLKQNYGLDEASVEKLVSDSVHILSRCGNPNELENSETGIVFGNVQSGKTMSFTTVISLAKDNRYKIVIVVAGISDILLSQTTDRLKQDLNQKTRRDFGWVFYQEPDEKELLNLDNLIKSWSNDKSFRYNSSLLITVKKNAFILKKLENLLSKLNLERIPTLIIDDESDQASLNTKAYKNNEIEVEYEFEYSRIYTLLKKIKNRFSHHTYLQYTATPQANIFINIFDILSPKFIRILEPGDKYVGGETFFLGNGEYLEHIESEKESEEDDNSPPKSLLYSLKIFFVGVAEVSITKKLKDNVSMLIHPSRKKLKHENYYHWVKQIKRDWQEVLNLEDSNQDKNDLLKEFHRAYKDLSKTEKNISEFKRIKDYLQTALTETNIIEVNTRNQKTPTVHWENSPYFILIGGQAMDRGFTVKGLTVTYMPRSKGSSNVDTLLQRSRFFGYKRDYLNFCRVFISEELEVLFKRIVEHEKDIRERLKLEEISDNLDKFDRKVKLSRLLRLTRKNVLSKELEPFTYGKQWKWTKTPHETPEVIENNKKVLSNFIKGKNFHEDRGDPKRTEEQKHDYAELELKELITFLQSLKYTLLSDSQMMLDVNTILEAYSNQNEKCVLYLMKKNKPRERRLANPEKSKKRENQIDQLFQGRNGEIYPGDKKIKISDSISVQVHKLNIKDPKGKNILHRDVIAIAIWIPEKFETDFVRQKK